MPVTSEHSATPAGKTRARGAGVPFQGQPGPLNAITDVSGIEVGYSTLIAGDGPLVAGKGPIRTGVTAILPRGRRAGTEAVFAGAFALNGNGDMSGLHWVEETGRLHGPIMITNTHSLGTVRDATIRWMNRQQDSEEAEGNTFWMPVTGETCDNWLNDMNGFHVSEEHVFDAIDSARGGAVEEGSVGGGTGMSCFQFKGGSGTASRHVTLLDTQYTLAAFVQTNFGIRHLCTIAGVPVGPHIPYTGGQKHRYLQGHDTDQGSIVVVIATDAPLLPHQLKRIARRGALGMARSGGIASNESGDFFLALSTANATALQNSYEVVQLEALGEFMMTPLFEATVQAVDEAILNSMFANETMVGRDGNVREALPLELVQKLLQQHGRWIDPRQA